MSRKTFLAAILLASATYSATQAHAQVADGTGDWLDTYTGAHDPGLDILTAAVQFDGSGYALTSVEAGPIDLSGHSLFVWGINRGAGSARLQVLGAPPPVGADKLFDALAVLLPGGTARVVTFPTAGPPTITVLPGAVTLDGNSISSIIPLSLLASTGFAPQDYTFTLWSRLRVDPTTDGNNGEIADFAPDSAGFKAALPEPASWALTIAGVGLLGGALRRRAAVPARAGRGGA